MVGHEVNSPLFLSTSLPWIFKVNSLLAVSPSWPPLGRPWSEFYSSPLSPLHGHLKEGHEVKSLRFLSPSWPIHGSHKVNSLLAGSPSWPPHGRQWSELSSIPLSFLPWLFKLNSLLGVSPSWPHHGRPWSEFSSIPLSPLHGHLIVGHEVNSLLFLSPSLPTHVRPSGEFSSCSLPFMATSW